VTRRFGSRAVIAAGALLLAACPWVFAREDAPARLEALNRALAAGVPALVARVGADKLSPPLIHSDWYVNEMAKTAPDEAGVEREKRQFGRRLVEALDKSSEDILALSDSSSREHAATTLLDLAQWIASRRGYGNMFVFDRCQDMATVPVAHLIRDLNYPEAKLDAIMARFVPLVDEVRMCAEAVNSEAPEPIFVPGKGSTLDEVQAPLQRAWSKQVRRIAESRMREGITRSIPWGRKDRVTLPRDFAFFCDDDTGDTPEPLTTVNQWDGKAHRRLVLGLGSKNLENIQCFALFRKKTGRFPTKPPSWWKPDDRLYRTPEKAAFTAAWRPFEKQLGPIADTAAMVYTAATANTFADQDTQAERLHEVKERAAAGGLERGPDGRVRAKDPRLHVGADGEITLVNPVPAGPTTRPNPWSVRIELPGTRPATQATTQAAIEAATQPVGQ
jgi:hypothetical protein